MSCRAAICWQSRTKSIQKYVYSIHFHCLVLQRLFAKSKTSFLSFNKSYLNTCKFLGQTNLLSTLWPIKIRGRKKQSIFIFLWANLNGLPLVKRLSHRNDQNEQWWIKVGKKQDKHIMTYLVQGRTFKAEASKLELLMSYFLSPWCLKIELFRRWPAILKQLERRLILKVLVPSLIYSVYLLTSAYVNVI